MRLAHISDLHFGSFALSPFQFFSKRWLGNFNFLLTRKRQFAYNRLMALIELFKEEKITHVLITGDLSVTARNVEFSMGQRFVDLLNKEGFEVFTVPGNHDHYTRRSYRKRSFYRFFEGKYDANCPFNLRDHKISYTQVADGLWLVGLDTAVATPWTSSQGYFSIEAEENLEQALKQIPQNDKIILMNHFPFFHNDPEKKQLMRAPMLKNLLNKYPQIFLYLHGHTHRQTVADLRPNQLPIISDSGSTPHIKGGACHLINFENKNVHLDVYRHDAEWQKSETYQFPL